MRIGLFGYGKMGKAIEELAVKAGDEIVLKIDSKNRNGLHAGILQLADVVIEFTRPESAFENVMACIEAGVPVVCGTTGWLDRLEEAVAFANEKDGALMVASNFSIGVNLFFALNRRLAALMDQQPQYDLHIEETHHIQKLDTPSGTAITLANEILANMERKSSWTKNTPSLPSELEVISHRIAAAPGTHEVIYHSPVDTITIRHEAHSREGFAAGALQAARWIVDKKGYFEMKDMLGF